MEKQHWIKSTIAQLGYFKTSKSRCMESLTTLEQICQLWSFPALYRIPGPSQCERKCIGAGSSGCMFEQAVADSHTDDVARGTLAATRAHTHTHARQHTYM